MAKPNKKPPEVIGTAADGSCILSDSRPFQTTTTEVVSNDEPEGVFDGLMITEAVKSLDEETLYIALLKKEALLIDASQSIRDAAPMISRMLETFDRYLALPTADETNPAVLKAQELISKAKGDKQ